MNILPATRNGNKITFYSDRFSVYFLIYGPQIVYSSSGSGSGSLKYWSGNYNFLVPYKDDFLQVFSVPNEKSHKVEFIKNELNITKLLYNPVEFSDVSNIHWAKDYIDFLAARHIVYGLPGEIFGGERQITRGEVVAMLVRLSGQKDSPKTNYFVDVDESLWCADYINLAYELGYVDGIGDGYFAPAREITKEEFIKILWNMLSSPKSDIKLKYKDRDEISSWAYEAVKYLSQTSIIEGTDKNELQPKNNVSRYEAAAMVSRYIKHIVEEAKHTKSITTLEKNIDNLKNH